MIQKPWIVIGFITAFAIAFINAISDPFVKPTYIPPSIQRNGNAKAGYEYLITGDYLKSGLPYGYFTLLNGKDSHNYLKRTGKNAIVPFGFNVVKANN